MGVAVVTGGTGGLGLEASIGLARAGFEVVVTGRSVERGGAAVLRVGEAVPGAVVRFARLDVASLASVAAFAATIDAPVAVLLNNAGVMALPTREVTEDGFERQFGTNHLGHFALTARLLPWLRGGRVVSVSSLAHRRGRIAFEDLQGERSYSPWVAYAQSKLADLMFARELQRRSDEAGWGVVGIAAHPGWARSELVVKGQGGERPGVKARVMQAGFNAFGQPTAAGAWPLVYAAVDAAAAPGGYYGPCCWGETRGQVSASRVMPQAAVEKDCSRLWEVSEELVGVRFGR